MYALYQQALDGTLVSPAVDSPETNMDVWNGLPFPVYWWWVSYTGELVPMLASVSVSPHSGWALPYGWNESANVFQSSNFVITSALSGGFICAFNATPTSESFYQTSSPLVYGSPDLSILSLDSAYLLGCNDIGQTPQPTTSMIIPCDSPLVVVGAGWAPNGNVVVREQYWHQTPSSYMLAPGQTNTVGFTTTTGMQQTTSEQSTVASSLGVSASAGWGPISASVSGSLSSEITRLQQFTASTETTQYQSTVLTNTGDVVQMALVWQLMDVVTVYDLTAGMAPIASMISAQTPTVIQIYDLPLSPPSPPVDVTGWMRANVPAGLKRQPNWNWRR